MENEKAKKGGFARVWQGIVLWSNRLKGVAFAIPVAVIAVLQALENLVLLPEEVHITTIDFAQQFAITTVTVGRFVAVMCPLALTAVSLVPLVCSKRIVFPWLVSLLTLALPIFLYLTNTFPG